MQLVTVNTEKNIGIQHPKKTLVLPEVTKPDDLLFTCGISGSLEKLFDKKDPSHLTKTEVFDLLLNDKNKSVLNEIVDTLKISDYKPKLLSNEDQAIRDSQLHLLGLIKYIEGDGQYYYEGITNCYDDSGKVSTIGFGHAHTPEKKSSNKNYCNQEQSYEILLKDLKDAYTYTKNGVDNRLGKGSFDKLPNSVKESCIDLALNKGPARVYNNKSIIRGLRNKDYVSIIPQMVYLKDIHNEKQLGLYKRSLARAILLTRDFDENDKQKALPKIKNIYLRAKKEMDNAAEITKMYNFYTNGSFPDKAYRADGNFKIPVKNSWVGKEIRDVAKEIYVAYDYDERNISYEKFLKSFLKSNPLKAGVTGFYKNQDIKVPKANYVNNRFTNEIEESVKPTKKNWLQRGWEKVKNGIKNFLDMSKADCLKLITGAGFLLTTLAGIFTRNSRAVKIGVTGLVATASANLIANEIKNNKEKAIREDEKQEVQNIETHTVKKGDSLYRIARENNLTVAELKKANGLTSDNIKIGQKLIVDTTKLASSDSANDKDVKPKKAGTERKTKEHVKRKTIAKSVNNSIATKQRPKTHTVKTKETLFSIARYYEVSLASLKNANGIKNNNIKIGQTLKIPPQKK